METNLSMFFPLFQHLERTIFWGSEPRTFQSFRNTQLEKTRDQERDRKVSERLGCQPEQRRTASHQWRHLPSQCDDFASSRPQWRQRRYDLVEIVVVDDRQKTDAIFASAVGDAAAGTRVVAAAVRAASGWEDRPDPADLEKAETKLFGRISGDRNRSLGWSRSSFHFDSLLRDKRRIESEGFRRKRQKQRPHRRLRHRHRRWRRHLERRHHL